MQTIAILGSTGSIGTQALELVRLHPEEFRVVALTARSSREKLFEQAVPLSLPVLHTGCKDPDSSHH